MVKKNYWGFTLIELLAAMVILGIIIAVAVPNIMGMLTSSKNNTYVEDAKKLVTTAEYKLRGDNTIDRPKGDGCVVMSLGYLDSSEFDNPPNGGKYMENNSFVVIKNQGGKFEYYVRLVEELSSGGHRGVSFAKSSDLYEKDSSFLIKNVNRNTLIKVPGDQDKWKNSLSNPYWSNGSMSSGSSIGSGGSAASGSGSSIGSGSTVGGSGSSIGSGSTVGGSGSSIGSGSTVGGSGSSIGSGSTVGGSGSSIGSGSTVGGSGSSIGSGSGINHRESDSGVTTVNCSSFIFYPNK